MSSNQSVQENQTAPWVPSQLNTSFFQRVDDIEEAVSSENAGKKSKFLLSKNGSPQNRRESKTNLATEISNFITIYETTWSKGRLRNISSVLNMFKDIVGAETIVSEINLSHISSYISKRKEKVGITTLRSDLQIIRTLFNSLIDENIITRSPINKKLVPKAE